MASVQSNVDWQSTKNTILERNRHMVNNSDMSDISFTCDGSDKIFYAHKYVLATSSAVFHAMFYGGLAEKESIVRLPDATEESLEQFLRFLYTEECTFTTENVFAIMYLAKKYILPSLKKECVDFLTENLNPENVLGVLDQATRFDEEDLKRHCWKVIQSNTIKVVTSDSFNNISQTTLAKLLKRNKLNIPEVELFQAVLKWIDFQCSCKNLEPTSKNRRSVIGKAIYAFRFFSMSQAEFIEHVSKSGLLTPHELVPIYEKFLGTDSPALKWKSPNRKPGKMVRFSRFTGSIDHFLVHIVCPAPQLSGRVTFSVDEDVLLLGVRLFGKHVECEYQVTLEVNEAKVTGEYVSEANQNNIPGFDVMLKNPIMVKKNDDVTINATIEGPPNFYSTNVLPAVTRKGITVTFHFDPFDTLFVEQFHEILLTIL